MPNSTHNACIKLAIVALGSQKRPSIHATAKKYALVKSTLRRRWNSESGSQEAIISEYRQQLIFAQEEILIK